MNLNHGSKNVEKHIKYIMVIFSSKNVLDQKKKKNTILVEKPKKTLFFYNGERGHGYSEIEFILTEFMLDTETALYRKLINR